MINNIYIILARALAESAGLIEVALNEESKVISFRNEDETYRINVYYTTRTVGTCVDHPSQGKTQLFRRNVSYEELTNLFNNPRIHTGRGYYKRSRAELENENQPNEIEALSSYINETEIELNKAKKQLTRLRDEETEKQKKKAAEEDARLAKIKEEKERESAIKEEEECQRRKRNMEIERGDHIYWSLHKCEHIPSDMTNVRCMSIVDGGYVALMDQVALVIMAYQSMHLNGSLVSRIS